MIQCLYHFYTFICNKKCDIDCRRKLHSVKSERFEGILEALMKNRHMLKTQFFGFDETLRVFQPNGEIFTHSKTSPLPVRGF